jgi:hypothetical protein
MVERIVRQFKPDKIILFGSHARGDAGPDSDVDLLIVMPVIRIRKSPRAPLVILNGAQRSEGSLVCEREKPSFRWPDPSASPQDDRVPAAHEFLRIRMTGSMREKAVEIGVALHDIAVPKDLIVVTPEEFEWRKDTIGTIEWPASREGEVLYARAG